MAMTFLRNMFKSGDKEPENYKTKVINTVEIQNKPRGSHGTEIYSGYSTEEYLSKLRDSERADVFDKMRRSDPQVKMCLSAIKNPIRAATVDIEPAGDTPQEREEADLIKHALFEGMKTPWKKFLGEALTIVEFGNAVFEISHKNVVDSKFGSYTGINDLGWRSPKTLERWNVDPDNGDLVSVSQYAYGDLQRLVDINAKFLMVINLEMEGANYEGISLLRPCYGNWFRKNNYLKINAIGVEKFAVPTPIVTMPNGRDNTGEYDELVDALEAYTTHESNYLIVPEGWEIDLKSNTYDPAKVEQSIDNEDKRMVKAFLANFLELGMSGTGSYALSNDLSDFFLGGIEYIAEEIAEKINQEVIVPLMKMNFGEREKYPKLKFSGIADKAGEELAKILNLLSGRNIITPDDQLEVHLRKRLGLPEMSEEGKRESMSAQPQLTLAERVRRLSEKEW